jgi:hypothetical protein
MFGFSQDAKMKNILTSIVNDIPVTKTVKTNINFSSPADQAPAAMPLIRRDPGFSRGSDFVQKTEDVVYRPKALTFDDMWMLREGLGDAIGQARQKLARGDVNATQVGELRKLFGAVSRDMDNWADSIGQPGISQTFKAANDAYRHYVVKYDIMQRAYDEATVASGKGSREYFSPQVFANKLRNIVYKDKELKRFTPTELSEMAGLANIMQVVQRSGQYAAGYNTGIQALTLGAPLSVGATVGGIAGGGVPGAMVGAGAVALGTSTLRFLTATKAGKALLMSSSHIDPKSYTMKMLINTIERNAPRALGFYPGRNE